MKRGFWIVIACMMLIGIVTGAIFYVSSESEATQVLANNVPTKPFCEINSVEKYVTNESVSFADEPVIVEFSLCYAVGSEKTCKQERFSIGKVEDVKKTVEERCLALFEEEEVNNAPVAVIDYLAEENLKQIKETVFDLVSKRWGIK